MRERASRGVSAGGPVLLCRKRRPACLSFISDCVVPGQAGDIFSELDEIAQLDPAGENTQIVEIRDRLQSARGDGFTSSQLEIFLGIFATLVQMLLLKILMIGQ
jgi:hypothetical protein